MKQDCSADEEAPDQKLWTCGSQAGPSHSCPLPHEIQPAGHKQRNQNIKAIKEYQFRVSGKIPYPFVIRRKILCACDPANVRLEETVRVWRMYIVFGVGLLVMFAMM